MANANAILMPHISLIKKAFPLRIFPSILFGLRVEITNRSLNPELYYVWVFPYLMVKQNRLNKNG